MKRTAKYIVSWQVSTNFKAGETFQGVPQLPEVQLEREFVSRPAAERLFNERLKKGFSAVFTAL